MFHNVEDHAFAPVFETFAHVYGEEEKYDNVEDHTKIAHTNIHTLCEDDDEEEEDNVRDEDEIVHTNIPCVRRMRRRRRRSRRRRRTIQGMKMR